MGIMFYIAKKRIIVDETKERGIKICRDRIDTVYRTRSVMGLRPEKKGASRFLPILTHYVAFKL
jgi:hypothetical protein